MHPIRGRAAVVAGGAAIVLPLLAGPALAHVEVGAAPARALAVGATLTMVAESESTTAGIIAVRIQLPAGLLPADFKIASAPAGWRVSGQGEVLQVRGPALPPRRDLRLSVRVRQLPQTRQLVLKTIQVYSDGREDGWIEVPSPGGAEPEFAAPVVSLAPAAAGSTALPRETAGPAPTATPTAPTAVPTTSPASPTPAPAPAAGESSGGSSAAAWLGGAVVLGLLTGGVVVWRRSRSGRAAR